VRTTESGRLALITAHHGCIAFPFAIPTARFLKLVDFTDMESLCGKCVLGGCGVGMSEMKGSKKGNGVGGTGRNCMPVTTHAFVALAATKADSFNLLSNDIRVMAGLDLKAAVVSP